MHIHFSEYNKQNHRGSGKQHKQKCKMQKKTPLKQHPLANKNRMDSTHLSTRHVSTTIGSSQSLLEMEESILKSSSKVARLLGSCAQHVSMILYTSGGHAAGFASNLRLVPLIASLMTSWSDMSAYGCSFTRVKTSHMVTPNAHTSDFCENLP